MSVSKIWLSGTKIHINYIMFNFARQLFKYFQSSLVAAFVNISSFMLLTAFFDINYIVAEPISFSLGLITNYKINTSWVFNKRNIDNKKIEFFIYSAIAATGLILGLILIWLFIEFLAFSLFLSKILQVGTIFWWNFLLKKYILFSKSEP